jgi:hypothetical protein
VVLLVRALKHPDSFECKIPQVPHVLVPLDALAAIYAVVAIMAASLVLGSNSTSLNSASMFLGMLRAAPSGGMCDRVLY